MSEFRLSQEFWTAAITLENYVAGMGKYRGEMRQRLSSVALLEANRARVSVLSQVRYVLVMTEDWCGDAVLNLPIIARISEALPNADMRIVYRSVHDDLNMYYQAQGMVNIPVVTFYDRGFKELGTWVERPQAAVVHFERWKEARPDFLKIRNAQDLSDEDRAERLKPYYAQLLVDMFEWYDGELNLQKATVEEVIGLLAQRV